MWSAAFSLFNADQEAAQDGRGVPVQSSVEGKSLETTKKLMSKSALDLNNAMGTMKGALDFLGARLGAKSETEILLRGKICAISNVVIHIKHYRLHRHHTNIIGPFGCVKA